MEATLQTLWQHFTKDSTVSRRFEELSERALNVHRCRVDRWMIILMTFQWVAGVGAAYWISPYTWEGTSYSPHIHTFAALYLGGLFFLFPAILAFRFPGRSCTRHAIAVGQLLTSGLLIHLSGGRIETHFHVFGSLAFLAFYRDWKVLISATLVTAVDHFLRGIYFPESVFGVITPEQWRWLEHAAWVVFEVSILIPYCLQSTKEMSEVALHQAQLEKALEHTAGLLDNIANGLAITDSDGKITYMNPLLREMFNVKDFSSKKSQTEEVLGERIATRIKRGKEVKKSDPFEVNLPKRGVGQVQVSPIVGQRIDRLEFEDEVLGQAVLVRDITKEKEVDQMKTNFIATVSHELRTPLTAILGYASLTQITLQESIKPRLNPDDEEGKEFVDMAAEDIGVICLEGERLTELINDLLDIAKIEAGGVKWQKKPFAFTDVMKSSLQSTTQLLKAKNLTLHTSIPSDLPKVFGDTHRITQVLVNLISNAVKFSDEGEITCSVTHKDQLMTFCITDTGKGIQEEESLSIFDKFKQSQSVESGKPQGTGLGLPICKEIIEGHGGRIWCESQLGKGSSFFFTLPLVEAQVRSPGSMSEEEMVKILIIEDHEKQGELLARRLSAKNYSVRVAKTGKEGVRYIHQEKPQVILLDYLLPDIDAPDFVKQLEKEQLSGMSILLMTALPREQIPRNLGVDKIMKKPLDIEQVVFEVEKMKKNQCDIKV